MPAATWMPALRNVAAEDAVDLLDSVSVNLERARAVAWSVSDQIERNLGDDTTSHNLCGQMETVCAQLVQAQDLIERLFATLVPHNSAAQWNLG